MSDIRPPISFRALVLNCKRVEVPLIQRDYAQGRESEKDVRDHFLGALHDALMQPGGVSPPLNLDFVYGSVEIEESSRFLPLDGQQRLTTLFLLHWYLAWHDGQLADFKSLLWDGKRSRFAYGVRPSSSEFFDALVSFVPENGTDCHPSVRRLLEDQPWFFLHWRLDPTIQSVLTMLDAIHARFRSSEGLYSRLVDPANPAITFHLLQLEHFGLSDDLYIKMNARGKPLTAFETFKARFEEHLKELFPTGTRSIGDKEFPVPEFFERRMDTQWADLFWSLNRDTFDAAALNLMWAQILVSLDPASVKFVDDTNNLRSQSLGAGFTLFHDRNWLTVRFAESLMDVLEAWSSGGAGLTPQLPVPTYFNEAVFLRKASATPWALTYLELVQFAAFVAYLTQYRDALKKDEIHQWMRIITNLAANTDIERPADYGRSLVVLRQLVADGHRLLGLLANGEIDVPWFSKLQVQEEGLKARLIMSHGGWQSRIERAECHAYFAGQIGFLLDFCGATDKAKSAPSNWSESDHASLQASFDAYLAKAERTFDASGLIDCGGEGKHLWKRALLSFGDYLRSGTANYSFLTNLPGNWDSWKRFLRDDNVSKRRHLKSLWDGVDSDLDIAQQLGNIIANASGLEEWRAAVVSHPEVITYCKEQEIRRDSRPEIYLLSKKAMSGYHAELFSYALHLDIIKNGIQNSLVPLKLQEYQPVYWEYIEPHLRLAYVESSQQVNFDVESAKGQFRIHASCAEVKRFPGLEILLAKLQFANAQDAEPRLERFVPRPEIVPVLQQLAQSLRNLPK